MSQSFRWTLLWIAGSAVGAIAALMMLSMSHYGGQFLPANPDAFYHARRILDAVFSGQPVIQFDAKIHVPEGSWLTWPWGFDQLLAWTTRALGPYPSEGAANRLLMNIPPAAMPIAVGLVVIIARQLALPMFLSTLLVMGFATMPEVYEQFGVGNVDHHFAELLWTLGTIAAGLWFFRDQKKSPWAGVVLGAVLGSAIAIHNGLFILQIPVALTMALLWLGRSALPDRRGMVAFALSLLGCSLLVCSRSEPWRQGFFQFYTLSWFHLYIAGCTAVFAMALSLLERSTRNIAIVCVAAALALWPIVGSLPFATEFLSGDLDSIRNVDEAQSPYELYFSQGDAMSTRVLSWLMWISAPLALMNLRWALTWRNADLRFLAIFGALGLILMQMQLRLCVFGIFPLILTPIMATKWLIDMRPQWRPKLSAACGALVVVAFYPTNANWHFNWLLGGQAAYQNLLPAFPTLEQLCAERPGVVLSDPNAGHWVRYHSDCSVIADVFLLTPQHARKALEVSELMRLTPAQLLESRATVRYVLSYHPSAIGHDVLGREYPDLEALRLKMPPLQRDLLGPETEVPPRFQRRWESRTSAGHVFARLYEIVPAS